MGNQRRFTPQDLTTLKSIKSGYAPPSNQPLDRLLTVEQTAQKLGVAPATIQRWTKEGRLKLKLNNQLQSGYSASQINSFLQSQKPQPVTPKPSPAPLTISRLTIPPAYLYIGIGSIILSLLVLGQLYLKNQTLIAKPAVNQLDLSQPAAPALPQVANFLNGQITIGSDTGQLSFLDDKGNLFLKNAALVQGGVFSSFLQLLPAVKPEAQIGRQYVDKESGDLMYFDGLAWTALNLNDSSSANLSSPAASASALTLPYTVLGGADQEILSLDDNSAYPVLISQPTKILANLYAPKLLDSDSETYYLDPSASDLSLSLAGNATISATLTFSQYGEYLTNTTDNYLIFSGGLGVNGTTTYGFNKDGNINANKIEGHDIIQIDNIKLDNNTINATNNDGLKFYDNDSNGINIQDGGNVGIGTTAPTEKFDLSGSIRLRGITNDFILSSHASNQTYYAKISSLSPTSQDVDLQFYTTTDAGATLTEVMRMTHNGNVGISTTNPTAKLEVAGDIKTTGGSFIDDGTTLNVPDYVFEPDYPLLSPVDLADYIHIYQHLPDIPSAQEIKAQGLNISQILLAILRKTEENVLYILDLYDRVARLEQRFLSPAVDTEKLTTNFISPLTADGQITVSGDVSISGTLTAAAISSSTIDAIKEKLASLAENIIPEVKEVPIPGMEASISALLANLSTSEVKDVPTSEVNVLNLDSLNANAGFFSDYLAVIGQAVITDLKINNSLTLGSVSALDGKIEFLAGLLTLSETGQVIINGNLTVTGTIIASQIEAAPDMPLDIKIASAAALLIYSDINQPIATFSGQIAQLSQLELATSGTATISAGTNNVIINPPQLTDKSQIIVTFNSNYAPASKYWVTKKPELNEFTIFTNYPVNNNATLDWLIIN